MKFLLQKLTTNTFYRIYVLVLLPIAISVVFLLGFMFYYNNTRVKILQNTYSYELKLAFQENENLIKEIISDIHHLSNNEQVMSLLNGSYNNANTSYTVSVFKAIKQKYEIIDSIAFLNRSQNTVVSSNGSNFFDKYLYEEYRYVDYNFNYWVYYQWPLSDVQIISPSSVYEWNVRKEILPVVFMQIDSIKISNLLIVNLDISAILKAVNKETLTKNSDISIINKQTRQLFHLQNGEATVYMDNELYKKIIHKTSDIFDYTISGEDKCLIISYSPTSSLLGYGYVSSIPYKDIYHSLSTIILFYCVIIALLVSIVAITAYFSAKQIYNPIEGLASLFKTDQSNTADTIEYIHSSILETINSRMDLSNKYAKAFPMVQERYLINLLNSNDYNISENDLISILQFKYEFFASVVIKLRFTDSFYHSYSNIDYRLLQNSIYDIVKSMFGEKYETFVVSSDKDTLYVLLNLESDEHHKTIISITDQFKSLLDNDREFIHLYIGVGNIYKSMEGLKKTHEEAVKSVSSISGLIQHTVKIYSQPSQEISYVFNEKDENALSNYLLAGYCDEAKTLISGSLGKCISDNVSERAILQLDVQILNIIFKVMRMRKIMYDESNEGDLNIISNIIDRPTTEIYNIIFQFVDKIGESTTRLNSKIDIQAVMQHIEAHYNTELYLEGTAHQFNTTGRYLSKLFISKLGISFLEYLNNLRINKAKVLLLETNKTITEIYQEVGFNNRNTFMRVFKGIMGVNPSDYRKANLRNNK